MPKGNDNQPNAAKKPTLARLLKQAIPDPESSLQYLRSRAEEHFDDFIILARRKGQDGYGLLWAASDKTWARGALDRVMRDYDEQDCCNIQLRNMPPDRD